jgi:hypothetical protein
MARPATKHPSTNLWGSPRMISLSLHVPGSPSSALTTRYRGLSPSATFSTTIRSVIAHLLSFSHPGLFIKLHLSPLGNPAPPRPLSPESLIVWMIQLSPFCKISLVLCQSPLDLAPFNPWSCLRKRLVKIRSWSLRPPYRRTGGSATVASDRADKGRARRRAGTRDRARGIKRDVDGSMLGVLLKE